MIRGKLNWLAIGENYPGLPSLIDHRFKLGGDLGVVEMTLEYGCNRNYSCEIFDLQDGKIAGTRPYFSEPVEAPDWRAQWVEKM